MGVMTSLSAEVRRAVDETLAVEGRRPVVFDADGTLWRGDVGEDLLRFLAAERRLPGRADGTYAQYEALVHADPAKAYAFAVEVMAGLDDATLAGWCADFFTSRYRGRVFPWVRPLLSALRGAGAEVWLCSASPRWAVEAGAAALEVPNERVIAVDAELESGRVTAAVKQPVPCGEGKVAWLEKKGVTPALAFGNGDLDLPMLAFAQRAVVVATPDGPDNRLVAEAKRRGWPVLRC